MGYTTTFNGVVTINPPLNEAEISFFKELAGTRRMDRRKGPLYAHDDGNFGQTQESDVVNYNNSHPSQPGLWLQFEINSEGTEVEWNGAEKFYSAERWMKYLIASLFSDEAVSYVAQHAGAANDPRLTKFTFDHVFNGEITAQGEDGDDRWLLIVENNKVYTEEMMMVPSGRRKEI